MERIIESNNEDTAPPVDPTQERLLAEDDADDVTDRLNIVYARESSELPLSYKKHNIGR